MRSRRWGWRGLYQDCVGTMIIDQVDRSYLEPIRALGMKAVATDTIMSRPGARRRI